MKGQQEKLPLPVAWPVTAPRTAVEREAAEEAARIQRRAAAEQRAVAMMCTVRQAVGMEALNQHVGIDTSTLYAQARGTRPPQLATFVAAIRFDPRFGHSALSSLAAEIGCVVVRRDEAPAGEVAEDAVLPVAAAG